MAVVSSESLLSVSRKACHQCRHETIPDQIAVCGSCPIGFCRKCLLIRYAEKLEDAKKTEHWRCPKCRGVCNCSVCMKKKGSIPTGSLSSAAKATGCVSVLGWLQKKGHGEATGAVLSSLPTPSEKPPVPPKNVKRKNPGGANKKDQSEGEKRQRKWKTWSFERATWVDAGSKFGRADGGGSKLASVNTCFQIGDHMGLENSAEGKVAMCPLEVESKHVNKVGMGELFEIMQPPVGVDHCPKVIKPTKRVIGNEYVAHNILLPQGTELTTVSGIELPTEDVGPALQFLEFCAAFGNVLGLTKGQPDLFLRLVFHGRAGRVGKSTPLVQFQIRLLSLLHENSGKSSRHINEKMWFQELKRYISCSPISPDLLDESVSSYNDIDPSRVLRILNFLCDEILGTEHIRSLISEENEKYEKEKKDERAKRISEKENQSPQHDGMSAPNHGSMKSSLIRKKKRSDALRTESLSIDANGHAFWRLKGYCNSSRIVLQDIKNFNMDASKDKWLVYDDEQEKTIEDHISSIKNWRWRNHRVLIRKALTLE